MPPWLRATSEGSELSIRVQPGASRSEVAGVHGDALKIRLTARAVEGAANAALVEFLAQVLGLPRREVRIQRGEKSRQKVVFLSMPVDLVAVRLESWI